MGGEPSGDSAESPGDGSAGDGSGGGVQIVRGGLQVFPLRGRDEFDSSGEFMDYIEEVNRYNNGLPPKGEERPRPPRTTDRAGESP